MNIAVLGYGSRGDIQPVVSLSDALVRRGHNVRTTVNVNSARWASTTGLDLVAIPPNVEDFLKSEAGRDLLANGKVQRAILEFARLERMHDADIMRGCREACEGADVIVSTMLTVQRAAIFAELQAVPHVSLATMPSLRTAAFACYLSPIRDLYVPALNRWTWDGASLLHWWSMKTLFNRARLEFGLPAWTRRPPVDRGAFLHAYSQHLSPLPADIPRGHVQCGHLTLTSELRARLNEAELPAGLQAWLDAGPAPVFFGFGSMPVLDPTALLRDVEELCRRHKIRALIGAGWSEYIERRLPDCIFMAAAFDHDSVLPRCRAAVHHGGAGTTHASLRAGLPTLVCSILVDQPYWGFRIAQLGAGTTFTFQRMNLTRLSNAIEVLLRPETCARAQRLGKALRAENGTERAAHEVEHIARHGTLSGAAA